MNQLKSIQRFSACVLAAMLGTATPFAGAYAQTTMRDFTATTTADFVHLCNTPPSDPDYVAAIHFCEGFAVGAYQYYRAMANDPADRFVCLPDPPPSRDSVKASFVAWAQGNPAAMNEAPVDSLFRFLGETYPCAAR